MENILTPEDKKYLRKISNYLRSMGMDNGNIEIHADQYEDEIPEVDFNELTTFSNNHRAEIPEGLIPILEKILDNLRDNASLSDVNVDPDQINYQTVEINIDPDSNTINVIHTWSYYETGDQELTTWEGDDAKQIYDSFKNNGVDLEELVDSEDDYLEIDYNGSGDSGYLEDEFYGVGISVPSEVENWAYSSLESRYGGWEINEGSDGYFMFYPKKNLIELHHTENISSDDMDTLYEEKF